MLKATEFELDTDDLILFSVGCSVFLKFVNPKGFLVFRSFFSFIDQSLDFFHDFPDMNY